jgi:hypothetical protein
VECEVLTAEIMKSVILWDVIPYSLVDFTMFERKNTRSPSSRQKSKLRMEKMVWIKEESQGLDQTN